MNSKTANSEGYLYINSFFFHLFFFFYRSEVADDLEVSPERSKFKNFPPKLVSKNASDSFSVVRQDRPENREQEKLNSNILDW